MRRIQIMLLAAITVLGLGLPAASAQATADIPGSTPAGTTAADDGLTKCSITVYGYKGQRWCEMAYSKTAGGEYFVVGTDYRIYHAWPGSGGWKTLGGTALASQLNGAWVYEGRARSGVWTYGTDGKRWCRDHPWTSGWFRCIIIED